ncbi:cobalamin biosynthesis protein CobS [Acetobacter orientalis]|uniref:Cobalamin biosynthesis protein CobS n=1 Tax=Acetobacter orientalis TaxID=146474 RepID=A0A2Z5ZDQ6_9PROT|nr:cobalamin biosynthesis protein CobS [Acetobacter orientalis]
MESAEMGGRSLGEAGFEDSVMLYPSVRYGGGQNKVPCCA